MSLTRIFQKISDQLSNFSEVELIYYTIDESDEKTTISYNVVCNLESIISNTKLLKTIIATKDIIRTLYAKTNIFIDYKIISLKEFEENILDNEATGYNDSELINANIIYSDNEFLSSIIEKENKKRIR